MLSRSVTRLIPTRRSEGRRGRVKPLGLDRNHHVATSPRGEIDSMYHQNKRCVVVS